jgi:hypothetical protein
MNRYNDDDCVTCVYSFLFQLLVGCITCTILAWCYTALFGRQGLHAIQFVALQNNTTIRKEQRIRWNCGVPLLSRSAPSELQNRQVDTSTHRMTSLEDCTNSIVPRTYVLYSTTYLTLFFNDSRAVMVMIDRYTIKE